MHNVCKKSAKHRIGMHEVTLKSAQLESKRKKVCKKCAWKWISHHLKCATLVQNIKKSLQKVCMKVYKTSKKCAIFLPNAHFADLCTLLKKCARICPPMGRGGPRRAEAGCGASGPVRRESLTFPSQRGDMEWMQCASKSIESRPIGKQLKFWSEIEIEVIEKLITQFAIRSERTTQFAGRSI